MEPSPPELSYFSIASILDNSSSIMKRYKIQVWMFLGCLTVVCLLMYFSYVGVIANDEGHGTSSTHFLEQLFSTLAFPTLKKDRS
jgi:hypothetical protein